ncbi:MuDR family transposase [Quillaja saponaria]|uniref:MuDR family transposase n=1 Tax=Quillaja saponaria TaxID=32244 RepID=A0AAD7VEC0_QUISA|nr:MuDR family transposase [Quillaja saponaria]
MANHDLIIGQEGDLCLMTIDHLAHEHNYNSGIGCRHDLETEQSQDLDLGHKQDDETHLGDAHDQGMTLSQRHEHGMVFPHELVQNLEENGVKLDEDGDPVAIQDHAGVHNHNDRLALTAQTYELDVSDNRELAVIDNHDLHEKLDFALDHNLEMGILPVSDVIVAEPQSFVASPVLQSRAQLPSPEMQLTVGQEFPDVHSCRRALRDAAIALRFEMQTIKSDKTRFTAKCASEGCPWRIHAAKLPGVPTFTIRTVHESHTCVGITHLGHQQASVQWVADSVEQSLRENPNYKPKEILEEIHRVHGIALSYKQAWRGKERIMAAVRGSFEEDYRLLPQYCDQIRRSNPGSIALIYGNPVDSCFQRLFISYQASIYGFLNACRPLIGLDRVPLKSKYLGMLLLASGFDGDGALYPLAFGVVDEETDDNWMWFLSELHNLLEINAGYMPRLTILSDRHKGIVDGVETNFPGAFHGFCMHHLSESFRKEFNSTVLINILWQAAYSLTDSEFQTKICEIESISREAATWIRRIPPNLWATAYFEGTRFGHMTANMAESLNALIVEASGFPIIQMMECIRRQLMTWFNERREASMQWSSVLVPYAERNVAEAIDHSHTFQVVRADEAVIEIGTPNTGSYVVDIRTRCCPCRGWQQWGLPCAHAVTALLYCRQNVHRFTESCFTVTNYRKAYSQTIHPIPDKSHWRFTDRFQMKVIVILMLMLS